MTDRFPLILTTPSIEKRGVEFNDLSASLSEKYNFSVLQAGGIPVTAPMTTSRAALSECVRRTDGLLLTGGDDIEPALYCDELPEDVRSTIDTSPDGGARDLRELVLIDECFSQRKPILAICRGHQLLNAAFGGSIIADIKRQCPGALNHKRMDKAGELVHEVALTQGSLLAKICGSQKLGVNSSHHQAVQVPAQPFMAAAISPDGLVEAMELKPELGLNHPFLLSVQFHPERLVQRHKAHRAIFKAFTNACAKNSRKQS